MQSAYYLTMTNGKPQYVAADGVVLDTQEEAANQYLLSALLDGHEPTVVVFADNTVETVISFWAVLKADAVVSIVNPLTKAEKLRYLINDCRPSGFITDAHLHHVWAEPAESRGCPEPAGADAAVRSRPDR